MSVKPRRRSAFARRIEIGDDKPLVRNYKAQAATADREEWHVEYDRVGKNVVGTLFKDNEIVRKNFIVKLENGYFNVDIGTGSGVKIKFKHGAVNAENC
jgi:hypothetical protein